MIPPSLGLINLLEWLTELRETFYLLVYRFIIKGYNSGRARWQRCIGQGVGKGKGVSRPRAPLPLNFHLFTSAEALPTQSFWVFYGGLLT